MLNMSHSKEQTPNVDMHLISLYVFFISIQKTSHKDFIYKVL